MNKIIQVQKKVQNVLKILIVIIIFPISSCSSVNTGQNSDYEIAQKIIDKINVEQKDTLYLVLKTNNSPIASLYEKNFKDSILYQQEKSRVWQSKGSYKEDTKLLDELFTQENYELIKSQIGESYWDISKFDKVGSVNILPDEDKVLGLKKHQLSLSRPVYTKGKRHALLTYSYKSMIAILVYEFKNNKWEEVKLIPIGIS